MANYTDPTTGLPMVSEGGEVYLRDANGFVKVPEALAGEYVAAQGYVPATAEEVAERKRIKEQEGFVGGTKAATKALAAHTMDAATAVLRVPLQAGAAAIGDDKAVRELENLSGHKFMENLAGIAAELTGDGTAESGSREWREATQAQYKAHEGVTTAAGIAGDVLGGLGLGAGAARAGTALEGALAGRVGQGLAKTAGAAAEFGLQGAAAGAGQASEQAYINGDPLTSQKLLAGIGLGAALGAGGGAALKGLGLAGRAVANKADDQLAKVFGRAQKAAAREGDQALEEVAAKALGPDNAPAPGLGTKLRDLLEDAQAAVTGTDRQALKKYGALRWDDEALRGREMAFRRDEILEGAKGEVTDRMSKMAKSAGDVMEEVRDSALKRDHVEKLLASDPAKAGAQKSAALRELWQIQDDLGKLAAAGDQFGNKRVVSGLQKIAEKAGAAVEGGSGADAFIGLDQIKRALQSDRVRLGRAAQQGSAFARGQAEQLGNALEGIQERVRQGLMDESVWGKAGAAQKEINAAWEQWFQHKSMFEQRFLQRTGETFQGRAIHEVDPAKVSSFLDKLGRKESALVDKHFRGYLDATERLTKAIGESHDIGAKAAKVADVANATKAIRETMTKADKTVAVANQIGEIIEADGGGALGPLLGGIAGGAPGAAAGALVSAVTNPGRMLKAAWGLQNVVGKVDLAINGQLDALFARAKQKAAGAANVSRRLGQAAARVALPAGVAVERFSAAGETRRMAYDKRREQIATLIANPPQLAEAIQRHIEPVSMASPNLGAQMALDMAKALRAVQDAAPTERASSVLTPQRDKRFVSDQDIQRFGDAWEGVVSPLSLLEDLRKGDLSYAKRDAVKTAYPDLFRDMQLAALDRLAKVDYGMPLQTRTQLDLLLELNGAGEPSLRPDFLARQNERAKMRAAQEQTNSPPSGRTPNIAKGVATLSESITVTTA